MIGREMCVVRMFLKSPVEFNVGDFRLSHPERCLGAVNAGAPSRKGTGVAQRTFPVELMSPAKDSSSSFKTASHLHAPAAFA
jgi:hypothetical protein